MSTYFDLIRLKIQDNDQKMSVHLHEAYQNSIGLVFLVCSSFRASLSDVYHDRNTERSIAQMVHALSCYTIIAIHSVNESEVVFKTSIFVEMWIQNVDDKYAVPCHFMYVGQYHTFCLMKCDYPRQES